MPEQEAYDDDILRVVGANIRFFREERGLSQSDLAERISITYQQIQKYENGTTSPTVTRISQIAATLGITIHALLRRDSHVKETERTYLETGETTMRLDPDEQRLVKMFRRIGDPRIRRSILAHIRTIATRQE